MITATNAVEYVYCWRVGMMMPHHVPCTECGQKDGHGNYGVPWNMCFLCGSAAFPTGNFQSIVCKGDILKCQCSTYTVANDSMVRTGDNKC